MELTDTEAMHPLLEMANAEAMTPSLQLTSTGPQLLHCAKRHKRPHNYH